MREILAKFEGRCAETGRAIPVGAAALYCPRTKRMYNWESKTYQKHREEHWTIIDQMKGIRKFFE